MLGSSEPLNCLSAPAYFLPWKGILSLVLACQQYPCACLVLCPGMQECGALCTMVAVLQARPNHCLGHKTSSDIARCQLGALSVSLWLRDIQVPRFLPEEVSLQADGCTSCLHVLTCLLFGNQKVCLWAYAVKHSFLGEETLTLSQGPVSSTEILPCCLPACDIHNSSDKIFALKTSCPCLP